MKATITPAKPEVTETIVVAEAVPEKVTLEMTLEEAQFVTNLFSTIGGCPHTTERRHQQAISNRLSAAGFRFEDGWSRKHGISSNYFKA